MSSGKSHVWLFCMHMNSIAANMLWAFVSLFITFTLSKIWKEFLYLLFAFGSRQNSLRILSYASKYFHDYYTHSFMHVFKIVHINFHFTYASNLNEWERKIFILAWFPAKKKFYYYVFFKLASFFSHNSQFFFTSNLESFTDKIFLQFKVKSIIHTRYCVIKSLIKKGIPFYPFGLFESPDVPAIFFIKVTKQLCGNKV